MATFHSKLGQMQQLRGESNGKYREHANKLELLQVEELAKHLKEFQKHDETECSKQHQLHILKQLKIIVARSL